MMLNTTITDIKKKIKENEDYMKSLYINLRRHQCRLKNTKYAEQTEIKWTLKSNPDTYRVAIIKNDYVIQVNSVNDGVPDSPLKKLVFDSEDAWRNSLPDDNSGRICITSPALTKKLLDLSTIPLIATTDSLKLKELELRFPDVEFILTNGLVRNMNINSYGDFSMMENCTDKLFANFAEMGVVGKPELMVFYEGYNIFLDNLL